MARKGIRFAYKQRGWRIPTRNIKCNEEDRQNLLQSELCSLNGWEWIKANETIMLIYILGKFSAIPQISGTDGVLSGGSFTFAQVIVRPIWINSYPRGQHMCLFFIRKSPAILPGSGLPASALVSTRIFWEVQDVTSPPSMGTDSEGILLTRN